MKVALYLIRCLGLWCFSSSLFIWIRPTPSPYLSATPECSISFSSVSYSMSSIIIIIFFIFFDPVYWFFYTYLFNSLFQFLIMMLLSMCFLIVCLKFFSSEKPSLKSISALFWKKKKFLYPRAPYNNLKEIKEKDNFKFFFCSIWFGLIFFIVKSFFFFFCWFRSSIFIVLLASRTVALWEKNDCIFYIKKKLSISHLMTSKFESIVEFYIEKKKWNEIKI